MNRCENVGAFGIAAVRFSPGHRDGGWWQRLSSPNVTVVELTRIVAAPRLVVIDGPADSSVYTRAVQPEPDLAAGDVLVRLRFAEPVIAP